MGGWVVKNSETGSIYGYYSKLVGARWDADDLNMHYQTDAYQVERYEEQSW